MSNEDLTEQRQDGQSRRKFIQTGSALAAATLAHHVASGPSLASAETLSPAFQSSGADSPGAKFRRVLADPEPGMAPGAYDIPSARLIEHHGFDAVVVGGSACALVGYGLPNTGLVTLTELTEFAGHIAQSMSLPVLADADDGGRTPLQTYRAIQGFEKAGLGCVMFEDRDLGPGGRLVSVDLMSDKVRAAVDARRDPDLVIMARCDAVSLGASVEEALDRGAAYAEAGADTLYFSGLGMEEYARATDFVNRPLISTVNDTPLADLKRYRISLGLYVGHALNVALGAAHESLGELKRTGRVANFSDRSLPRDVSRMLTTRR